MLRKSLLSLFAGIVLCGGPFHLCAADKSSEDQVKLIVKLLGDADPEFRAAGLDQIRTGAKGAANTQTFAAQLSKLEAPAQAALLNALADRGDAAARPAVLELAAASEDETVRASAIRSLGTLGGADDLPLLLKTLSASSNDERNAAKRSLVLLGGKGISRSVAAELKTAPANVKTALIEVLATRRASDELPTLVAATTDDTDKVRSAAMTAVSQIGKAEQVAALLPGVLKAGKGGERDHAERCVAMICSRIGNEDQRGSKLIEALATVPASERDDLLPLIGRVGGKKLINFVGDIASEADPVRRKLGIDALSKWPDASVADKLLEIANKTTDAAERNQAFQGYVKIAATRDQRSDKERLDRMKEAMKVARTPEEQSLVLNRTRTAYDVAAVRFVMPYVEDPDLAQIACETVVEIAHHREVRDPHKAEFDKDLDKVIEVSKDPVVIERANRYKRGETWERPKK